MNIKQAINQWTGRRNRYKAKNKEKGFFTTHPLLYEELRMKGVHLQRIAPFCKFEPINCYGRLRANYFYRVHGRFIWLELEPHFSGVKRRTFSKIYDLFSTVRSHSVYYKTLPERHIFSREYTTLWMHIPKPSYSILRNQFYRTGCFYTLIKRPCKTFSKSWPHRTLPSA